jgi:ubiquinone/menaquinone biosynthesis C-methylase UbiE
MSTTLKDVHNYFDDFYLQMGEAQLLEKEKDRLNLMNLQIPDGVTKVLEVGCGNGRQSNMLSQRYEVVRTDLSFNCLRNNFYPSIQADASLLPFRSNTFDIVICSEVLEHIPDYLYCAVLGEIERASQDYILISVPFKECLQSRKIKCFHCGNVFHKWLHLRSFSLKNIKELFSGFNLVSYSFSGKHPVYNNKFLLYISQHIGKGWSEPDKSTICPGCNSKDFMWRRNFITKCCSLVQKGMRLFTKVPKGNWVVGLYQKTT